MLSGISSTGILDLRMIHQETHQQKCNKGLSKGQKSVAAQHPGRKAIAKDPSALYHPHTFISQ